MSSRTLISTQMGETWNAPHHAQAEESQESASWTGLYRIGAVAAFGVVAMIPIQAALYIVQRHGIQRWLFLSGVAMLLISAVILRGNVFSRATGVAGLMAGVTGLVPASFGALGFVLSFASLLPLVVWLALIGRRLLQLQRNIERPR